MNTNDQMSNGAVNIPASSFSQRQDMNIQPNPINISFGSVPQQWTSSQPLTMSDLKGNSYRVLRFEEFGV